MDQETTHGERDASIAPRSGMRANSRRVQDMEELDRLIDGAAFEVMKTAPGTLDAAIRRSTIGDLSVDQGEINLPMRVRGSLDPHRCTIGLFQPGPSATYNGHSVGTSTLLWFQPGGELDGHHQEAHRWTAITVPLEWSTTMAATARRPASMHARVACRALRPPAHELREMQWAAHALLHGPGSSDAQDVDARWLINGIRNSLSASFSALDAPLGREASHSMARFSIARRADRHLRERLTEPVLIDDLCIGLRVSRRYLEYCFRSAFGVSPSRYARLLRLHEVRRRLQRANAETTVTREALRMGFSHLGQFAAQYKGIFGESPRDTLADANGLRPVPVARQASD